MIQFWIIISKKFDIVHETVEVEIKVIVHLQRVGVGGSPIERSLSNGPRRAQSKAFQAEYSAT
ncbi:MAG: hypothetical protein ACI4F9_05730 [Lachnospiraceae bacterium]